MKAFLKRLRMWRLVPYVGKRQAARIARENVVPDIRQFRVYSKKPKNVHVFNLPKEPCWFVFAPGADGLDEGILGSSRLILVSKISGRVLFNGSAHDEG